MFPLFPVFIRAYLFILCTQFDILNSEDEKFQSAACVSLEEFINIDESLGWETLPVILSSGQKT